MKQDGLAPLNPDGAISKEITFTKKEKLKSVGVPVAISSGGVSVMALYGSLSHVPEADFISGTAAVAVILYTFSAFLGNSLLSITRKAKVAQALYNDFDGDEWNKTSTDLKAAKKGRTFINSFQVREPGEIDVHVWKLADQAVSADKGTHTVKQYLVKEGKALRVEQEIIPQAETIWDLSADALIEVYGVQEKTELQKGVMA